MHATQYHQQLLKACKISQGLQEFQTCHALRGRKTNYETKKQAPMHNASKRLLYTLCEEKKNSGTKNKYSTSNLAVTRGIQDTLEAKVL
jgi:hypothetical protein